MTIIERFQSMVDLALQKALNAKKPLSPEMTQLLTLVIFGGYDLFPATGPKRRDDLPGPNAARSTDSTGSA